MTPYEFSRVRNADDVESAIDAVFHEAYDRWTDQGQDSLSEGQITVLTVWTFFGEVLNGGFWQYFANASGGLANLAPASLRRVGLPKYAEILERFLTLFPDGRVAEDADIRMEQRHSLSEKFDGEYFEELEQPFWDIFEDDREFTQKLFAYICEHEAEFLI